MKYKTFPAVFLFVLFNALPAYPAFDSADFASEKPLKIIRVTPAGEDVPAGRQIVVQFNRAVVPLGRMKRSAKELPIEVTPSLNCEWRWLNTSALACQLGEKDALAFSTRYNISIHPGINAEDGTAIAKSYHHQFITERPKIRHAWFDTWRAPGTPVIRLIFNQSVGKDSVEQHVYMTERDEPSKRFRLKVAPDPRDHEKPRFMPLFGEGYYLDFGKTKPVKSDDDPRKINGVEARRVWLSGVS